MFLHELAPKCTFNKMCKKKMCPYQHDNTNIFKNDIESNNFNDQELQTLKKVLMIMMMKSVIQKQNLKTKKMNVEHVVKCLKMGVIWLNIT